MLLAKSCVANIVSDEKPRYYYNQQQRTTVCSVVLRTNKNFRFRCDTAYIFPHFCNSFITVFITASVSQTIHRPTELRLLNKIPQQRSGFSSRPVHLKFLVDKVALSQVFLRELLIYPVNIIPINFILTHSSTINTIQPSKLKAIS